MKKLFFLLLLTIYIYPQQEGIYKIITVSLKNRVANEPFVTEGSGTIKITNSSLSLSNGYTYTFISDLMYTSDNNLSYIYALNQDWTKCRIWFKRISGTKINIVVEFNDIIVTYNCKKLN